MTDATFWEETAATPEGGVHLKFSEKSVIHRIFPTPKLDCLAG